MPMDRSRYPVNWDEIATSVKERAGWKCEECRLRHGEVIVRSDIDADRYIILDDTNWEWYWLNGERLYIAFVPDEFDIIMGPQRVILTVHHVGVDKPDGSPGSPHDKMDCRPENLKALCQRCHLVADAPHRKVAMRIKDVDRQRRAGQQELW